MYLSWHVSKHAFKTARGRKGSAVCLLAGEEPARGRHSFVCVEQRGSCEEQMFVPNVLPSAADERELFIIVTEDILVVILESFFPSFLIPVRLRSLPKQEVIAQPSSGAGAVAPGEGQGARHESCPAEGFKCRGQS